MRESENAESCVKKIKELLRIWWVTRKRYHSFSASPFLPHSLMFSSETLCWKFKQNQYFPSCQIHKSIFSKAEFSSYHLSWWKLSIFDVKEKVIYSVHILSKQFYFLNVMLYNIYVTLCHLFSGPIKEKEVWGRKEEGKEGRKGREFLLTYSLERTIAPNRREKINAITCEMRKTARAAETESSSI